MKRSSEYNNGTLYLISTPIGNLADISERAKDLIEHVDYLFCEDTRVSAKLLTFLGISRHLDSFHDYSDESKEDYIISLLLNNKTVGLISDSGTPVISDPGFELVRKARLNNIKVSPIPGASAQVSALISSGLPSKPYLFYGFLDHKLSNKKKELETLKNYPFTLVFYESPLRINETIKIMYEVFNDRSAVLYREITKLYEESIDFNLSEYDIFPKDLKGEMVLVVSGYNELENKTLENDIDLKDEIDKLIKDGLSLKEASKIVGSKLNQKSSEIYNNYLRLKK